MREQIDVHLVIFLKISFFGLWEMSECVCMFTCPCHSGCLDPAWLCHSEENSDCDQCQWTGCYSKKDRDAKGCYTLRTALDQCREYGDILKMEDCFPLSTHTSDLIVITGTKLTPNCILGYFV